MIPMMRPLVAVMCLFLSVQCFLYALSFLRSSSMLQLGIREGSKTGIGSRPSDVHQYLGYHYGKGSTWQADEERVKLKEEVNRDLLDMKVKPNGSETLLRNITMFLELLRLLSDSDLRSNQSKRRNDSKGDRRFDNISQMKVVSRPLNPLEEYFMTVRNKSSDIRKGPTVNSLDFPYVINPGNKTCAGQQVFLIAFVPTAIEHYDFRRVIRKTWAVTSDFRLQVRNVFVVGRLTGKNASRLEQLVELESRDFGDIVQADFLDTYDNLTYKALVGLRWATTYCSQARYVLKIDDDTFVNMFALLEWLEQDAKRSSRSSFFAASSTVSSSSSRSLISSTAFYTSDLALFGRVVRYDAVHRTGKWAVPESKFRYVYYPPYCSGPAYVLTMAMAAQVVSDSLYVPFFHLEDVYVTGFVTMLAGDSVRFVQWEHAFVFLGAFPRVFLTHNRNKYLFALEVENHRLYKDTWFQMRQFYTNSRTQSADTIRQHRR